MDNMYNFDHLDADEQLKNNPTAGGEFPYRLFEAYIQHLYSRITQDETVMNNYDGAYFSMACAQFYPNFEWMHPETFPNNLLHELLSIGMVETSNGVLRFKKQSYPYFFICKFLIRSWAQLNAVDNLSEEFFKPSGKYLRTFLNSYGDVNESFQTNLQALLRKNLFHILQSSTSELEIISAEKLDINMKFGYEFLSFFLAQTDLKKLKSVLNDAFHKVGGFGFEKTDETHINNLGLLYAHFLNQAKLQNQLYSNDAQSILKILDKSPNYKINFKKLYLVLGKPESLTNFLMDSCNELQYVLLCQFIKFFFPNVRLDIESMNNNRFQKVIQLQVPIPGTVEYIYENYPIRNAGIREALFLERYGLAIALGTMTFTHDMISTFKYYLNTEDYWGYVYKNKILVELIMPFIQLIMSNYPTDANKNELLKLLLDFSDIALKRKMDSTSLKTTLRFIESMIVEDHNNLEHFKNFLIFLSNNNFCLIRKGNRLRIINQKYDFIYDIDTDSDVISSFFE